MENNVRAVERAIQLLNCFEEGKESFSLSELSAKVNLAPSTALRILSTLEKQNYIYKSQETSRYYLGFQLARISHVAFSNLSVVKISQGELERLSNLFGEGVGIFIRKESQRVCVNRIEGKGGLRSFIQIGNQAPLTRGASGMVLLSGLSDDEILKEIAQDKFHSIEDIREMRKNGYAVSYGERQKGVVSVSAPIYNSLSKVEAALFISAPESNLTNGLIKEIIKELRESARNISTLLGFKEL